MENTKYQVFSLDETCRRIEENGVRSFLVEGTKTAALIDTGLGTGNIKDLVESLTDLPIIVVNTHADGDHIGCNHLFGEANMHPGEFDRYRSKGGSSDGLKALWEGDIIDLGGRKLEVILIPGHTPGSIALLDCENKVLFSGDSISTSTIYMFGDGRNLPAYIASMKKLQKRKAEFDTVYPAHGDIPVKSDILPELIKGAEDILAGKLQGADPERDIEAKIYDVKCAKFLF